MFVFETVLCTDCDEGAWSGLSLDYLFTYTRPPRARNVVPQRGLDVRVIVWRCTVPSVLVSSPYMATAHKPIAGSQEEVL